VYGRDHLVRHRPAGVCRFGAADQSNELAFSAPSSDLNKLHSYAEFTVTSSTSEPDHSRHLTTAVRACVTTN
jgi:hypothetical protein